jgi:hypothetical protein
MTTCNSCGESCSLGTLHDDVQSNGGLIDAEVQGGYNSTPGNGAGALDDMTSYKFSLCEFCLDHLFQQFKIPPTVYDFIDDEIAEPWRSAHQRVTEDEWRKQKKEFYEEYFRRNQLRDPDRRSDQK